MSFLSVHQGGEIRLDCSRARQAHHGFDFTRLMAGPDRAPRLEGLQESFAAARLYAQAMDFTAARRRLHLGASYWPPGPRRSAARVLVVAHASLSTLALIAEAQDADWNLVIEDGDFTGDFIVPLCANTPGRVTFVPAAKLPLVWQKHRNRGIGGATAWITLCDRPAHAGGCSLSVDLSRGKYHLSVIDALLMVSGFDEVFVLGRELKRIAVQHTLDDRDSRVSGETLMQYARQAIAGLLESMECCPEKYLGITSLMTRSERYRALVRNNKRALVKSLLQYSQTNGLPLPVEVYHDFLQTASSSA